MIDVIRAASSDEPVARLYLSGPIRLINANGVNCTPAGTVRKALLSLLVLSPSFSRSRSTLQTMLWEDMSASKASGSLRTALSILRKELREGLGADPVKTDNQTVTINLSNIWVDVFDPRQSAGSGEDECAPELLEGLDLKVRCGESFEEWLGQIRMQWPDQIDCPDFHWQTRPAMEPAPIPGRNLLAPVSKLPVRTGIGILPPIVATITPMTDSFADSVIDAIAKDISTLGDIDIYDYRDNPLDIPTSPSQNGPTVFIRLKLAIESDIFILQFHAFTADSRKLVAGSSVTSDIADGMTTFNPVVAGFIAQNVDRLIHWMEKSIDSQTLLQARPYHILNKLFQFQPSTLYQWFDILSNRIDGEENAVYSGLLAYLLTFKVGENWDSYDEQTHELSNLLVNNVIRDGCSNSVSLALAGHVAGYTLHDHDLATDLLHTALDLSPTIPICWDHLALHHLYTGNFDKAIAASQKALRLGAYSPFRFSYETTMCMIATLKGDFDTALRYGTMAQRRKPEFNAAARYLLVSHAHLGQMDRAREYLDKLTQNDPSFAIDWVDSGRWPLPDDDAKDLVRRGLVLSSGYQ